jgi:hypothetical protein
MKPPKIDRASRVLIKKVAAMSNNERTRLKRFLDNIDLLGDVEKAAAKARVSKGLLDKWMNAPEISLAVNNALIEAHPSPFFWAKIARPHLQQQDWRYLAKLTAHNLKDWKDIIRFAAENNEKKFFVDLGKCLSGEINCTLRDQMEIDIADILHCNPSISAKDAVREMEERRWTVSEEALRMRKQRMKRDPGAVAFARALHAIYYET